MWLALLPLLGLGLWWPQAVWDYFGAIAQALGHGTLVTGAAP
jgi:hydrogenase-4 component F